MGRLTHPYLAIRFGYLTAFTGFTAIVNKELSARYETLVNKAPELIKVLPWGPDFEVDVFRKPDFTALEVLSFATGGMYYSPSRPLDPLSSLMRLTSDILGIPAGINVSGYIAMIEAMRPMRSLDPRGYTDS